MIIEYHRPKSIDTALALLARQEPFTLPLAGGTVVSQPSPSRYAVVDLQDLGLKRIERRGKELLIGAAASLQALAGEADLPPALLKAIQHEATYNLRQAASIAGTLIASDGRSPLAASLLALDAHMLLLPGEETISLGDLLPLRSQRLRGRLVTQVSLPLNARLAYESVARTPADLPIVCVALARWPSGRTRIALGGFGPATILAFDGPDAQGAEIAARSAYANANDEWASAEYRQDVSATLARRCLDEISD
jgi:CO/xanthine dehydrogenase FAD-binding subunit